jgi:prepilin-type N-terminal cleavage/methylation domain-containing protein
VSKQKIVRQNGRKWQCDESGFSLVELSIVVAIMATVAAIAILVSPMMMRQAKADSGIEQAVAALRIARETAIGQRRNVTIEFIGLRGIRTSRQEIGANGTPAGTTPLNTVELENNMQVRLEPGLPDTPDGFGHTSAVNFGPSPERMFTSEGTLVNQTGDVINGSVFFAIPDDPLSARAISIFGPTALIRVWRWDGRQWVG